MSLQWSGRSWGPKGDSGLTFAVLDDATDACRRFDVVELHTAVGFATDCVRALVPDAAGWSEVGELHGVWWALGSAVVNRPPAHLLVELVDVAERRLAAVRDRLRRHEADVLVVAAMEQGLGIP